MVFQNFSHHAKRRKPHELLCTSRIVFTQHMPRQLTRASTIVFTQHTLYSTCTTFNDNSQDKLGGVRGVQDQAQGLENEAQMLRGYHDFTDKRFFEKNMPTTMTPELQCKYDLFVPNPRPSPHPATMEAIVGVKPPKLKVVETQTATSVLQKASSKRQAPEGRLKKARWVVKEGAMEDATLFSCCTC